MHKSGEPPPETATIKVTAGDTDAARARGEAKPRKVKDDSKPGFMKRMGHFFRRLFGAE